MFQIGFHRAIAVTAGILWAALVSRFWWPAEARRELSKSLSEFSTECVPFDSKRFNVQFLDFARILDGYTLVWLLPTLSHLSIDKKIRREEDQFAAQDASSPQFFRILSKNLWQCGFCLLHRSVTHYISLQGTPFTDQIDWATKLAFASTARTSTERTVSCRALPPCLD